MRIIILRNEKAMDIQSLINFKSEIEILLSMLNAEVDNPYLNRSNDLSIKWREACSVLTESAQSVNYYIYNVGRRVGKMDGTKGTSSIETEKIDEKEMVQIEFRCISSVSGVANYVKKYIIKEREKKGLALKKIKKGDIVSLCLNPKVLYKVIGGIKGDNVYPAIRISKRIRWDGWTDTMDVDAAWVNKIKP